MSNITELRAAAELAKRDYQDAQRRLDGAMIEEFPVKAGDTMSDTRGRKGRVSCVFIHYNEVAFSLTLIKKDGSLGKLEHTARSWEKWKKIDG